MEVGNGGSPRVGAEPEDASGGMAGVTAEAGGGSAAAPLADGGGSGGVGDGIGTETAVADSGVCGLLCCACAGTGAWLMFCVAAGAGVAARAAADGGGEGVKGAGEAACAWAADEAAGVAAAVLGVLLPEDGCCAGAVVTAIGSFLPRASTVLKNANTLWRSLERG
jgi:hypothetical protein